MGRPSPAQAGTSRQPKSKAASKGPGEAGGRPSFLPAACPVGWGAAGVSREPCKAGMSCALGLPGLAVGGLRGELWVQVALLCL